MSEPTDLDEIREWIRLTREQLAATDMHCGIREECLRALAALEELLIPIAFNRDDTIARNILAILNGEREEPGDDTR